MTKNIEIIQVFRDIERFFVIVFTTLISCMVAILFT